MTVHCPNCGARVPTRKAAREDKRTATRDADARVRERVFKRDGHRCCNCGGTYGLQLDHFHGRARDRSESGCWTLCAVCHQMKTVNQPSRRWWLNLFRTYIASFDVCAAVRVDELLAKDEGKRGTR